MHVRDSESFDSFYAGSVRRVTSQLYALTGDRSEAEDVVQEAYARAWQRWDKVGSYDDPESWVRTVAWRISVSAWRKTISRSSAHRRHGIPPPVPEVSPDYVAMIGALRKISDDQRRAIVLYHLVGLSVPEVARETGASPAAVKARLTRGRRALSAHLSDASTGPGPEEVSSRA
jgi:RNA polymerase sigma-70 factor, ECF subfamily